MPFQRQSGIFLFYVIVIAETETLEKRRERKRAQGCLVQKWIDLNLHAADKHSAAH